MDAATIPMTGVAGRALLFVMAADAEYGSHLSRRFRPFITGVGPVEAALAMGAALQGLRAGASSPHLVVSLGSAGSRTLEQTQVYQASRVSYRDMDASPLGFEKGVTPFLDQPAEIALPLRVPGVPEATLSTGAGVVSGAAYDTVAADMVDMETYAVMRACQRFHVPLLVLRGISDGAEELRHVDGWTRYLHVVDERLAAAVDRLEKALAAGEVTA